MQAAAHDGDGLEAAVRVLREAGHDLAVVHAPAVLALEVLAQVAPGQRRGRALALVARAGSASSWCTQNRNGSLVCQGKPSGVTATTASVFFMLRASSLLRA